MKSAIICKEIKANGSVNT